MASINNETALINRKIGIARVRQTIGEMTDDELIRQLARLRDQLPTGGPELLQSWARTQAEVRNYANGSGVDGEALRAKIARIRQEGGYS